MWKRSMAMTVEKIQVFLLEQQTIVGGTPFYQPREVIEIDPRKITDFLKKELNLKPADPFDHSIWVNFFGTEIFKLTGITLSKVKDEN